MAGTVAAHSVAVGAAVTAGAGGTRMTTAAGGSTVAAGAGVAAAPSRASSPVSARTATAPPQISEQSRVGRAIPRPARGRLSLIVLGPFVALRMPPRTYGARRPRARTARRRSAERPSSRLFLLPRRTTDHVIRCLDLAGRHGTPRHRPDDRGRPAG